VTFRSPRCNARREGRKALCTVFRPCLASHCSGETETSYLALRADTLQIVKVWSKPVSNEGHFSLEAERLFRLYFTSYFSGVTETSHLALRTHSIPAVEVCSKSVGNEGHFTGEGDRSFTSGTLFPCATSSATHYRTIYTKFHSL
jgi:hypothetical protein